MSKFEAKSAIPAPNSKDRKEIWTRDVEFGIQFWSDWHQMGQILDFFGPSQKVLKMVLESPRFVPFWAHLTHFGPKSGHPDSYRRVLSDDWNDVCRSENVKFDVSGQ